MSVKKEVCSAFMGMGVVLETEAVAVLTAFLEAQPYLEEALKSIVDAVESENVLRVTASKAQELIESLKGDTAATPPVQIINAYDIPQMCFDPIRKAFYLSQARLSLQGSAKDKINVRVERFLLLRQRVLRNPAFMRPVFGGLGATTRQYCQLTEIRAMAGQYGVTLYVMGYITQMADGRYYLEDLSDAVPLDVSGAETPAGFFTEGCVVIAEGELQHSGVFKANSLVFPPVEAKAESEAAVKGLNFFGGTPSDDEGGREAMETDVEASDDRIVFAANLWLDQPETLSRMRTVLSGFEDMDAVPSMFVLMGDFQSYSCNTVSTDHNSIRDNFRRLAHLIAQFHRLRDSTWVFVPGPRDPGLGGILPRPPLADVFRAEVRAHLPAAVFASNPCRIRYHGTQVVVFRDDLEARMRKLCLLPPAGNEMPETMFENLAATLLQQSHLCPLPMAVQPVFWCYDHALRLYPLPDVCIIADPCRAAEFSYEGCVCLNPGSFMNGTFAALKTASKEVEACQLPQDDD